MKNILLIISILFATTFISAQEFWVSHNFEPPILCPPTVDDDEANTYNTVIIGDQCWMAESLNIGTRIDAATEQSDNGTLEKYCYADLESNCDLLGGLYQWDEMMDYIETQGSRGICPSGWHIPTNGDWNVLQANLGADPGGKMKAVSGSPAWTAPNAGATNGSGFTALPGGWWDDSDEAYEGLNTHSYFWSSTLRSTTTWPARYYYMYYNNTNVTTYPYRKTTGVSVRCLKD